MFPDHRDRNIRVLPFPNQRRDSRRNERYVRQVHVEPHEIFPKDNRRLSLKITRMRVTIQHSNKEKHTTNNSTCASEIQLQIFAESTGILIHARLSITKCFQ